MRAGPRNRLIVFERVGAATDTGLRSKAGAFAEHARAWAEVSFGRGDERRQAAQENASAPATFRTLWNPTLATVTAKDRINYGGYWDITSIAPLGLNEGIEFTAVRAA
jgi:head-tail adaptor